MVYKSTEDTRRYIRNWMKRKYHKDFEYREQNKARSREYYMQNAECCKEKVAKRREKIRDWLKEYKKGLVCGICGEDTPCCLDFHHKGKKDWGIAKMVANNRGIEKILEEISKCDVVCANCHRKIHAGIEVI